MLNSGRLFILGLWAVGIVTGLVAARAPHLLPVPTPALIVPLAVALVADLALRPSIEAGRIAPITMNERAVGVIGAGLAAVLLLAVLGS